MEKKNNKIIHYIWFGGNPLSELTKKCIASWKKYLPDFEIMEWNESNFDTNQCPFIKEAYEQKKWAFVADYTRFKVLEEYGGIYLDTDMEVTKDVSKFLEHDLFMGVEDSKMINAAVVWAKEPHNPHIQNIVKYYESKKHFNETGDLYDESVPKVLTRYFGTLGFDGEKDEIQEFDDGKAVIYPMEYFYPKSYDYQHNKFTENSHMIHHFDATWISPMERFKTDMKRKNMVWVVYVIDFFINLKNKIKFFSNPRDLTIFVTMFLIMLLSMFAVKPVDGNGGFGALSNKSIWQILGLSLVWTYITAKTRNIDLNAYMDKLTGADPDAEVYKPIKLTDKQEIKLTKRQNLLFAMQLIVTLFVAFMPAVELISMWPNTVTLYGVLSLVNMYFIYLGVKKNFKYRILELIPYAIILGLMIMLCPAVGILNSVCTFVFVMTNLVKRKVKIKRIKSFCISYVVAAILFIVLSFAISNVNNIKETEFKFNTLSNEKINVELNEENKVTEFNAAKGLFEDRIEDSIKSETSVKIGFFTVFAIIFAVVMCIIAKNAGYLFLGVISILNSVQLMNISSDNMLYLACVTAVIMLLMLVHIVSKKLIDKE